MFNIFFLFGLMLGVRIVALIITKKSDKIEEQQFCKRHTWITKQIDPSDPEAGSYLVCNVCKWLPESQGFEQS